MTKKELLEFIHEQIKIEVAMTMPEVIKKVLKGAMSEIVQEMKNIVPPASTQKKTTKPVSESIKTLDNTERRKLMQKHMVDPDFSTIGDDQVTDFITDSAIDEGDIVILDDKTGSPIALNENRLPEEIKTTVESVMANVKKDYRSLMKTINKR